MDKLQTLTENCLVRDGAAAYSLSDIQCALLHEGKTRGVGCNIVLPLLFTGNLDLKMLHLAAMTVLRRHWALRLSVAKNAGHIEMIDIDGELNRPFRCFCHHSDRASLQRATRYGFHFAEEPGVHFHYLALDPLKHVLMIVASPIVVDMTSMRLLTTELWDIYQAIVQGQSLECPPDTLQYLRRKTANIEAPTSASLRCKSFIKGTLQRLDRDSLETKIQESVPDIATVRINSYRHKRLVEVAHKYNVSMEILLMAAIARLFTSIGGSQSCLLAADALTRNRPTMERKIGCIDSIFPFTLCVSPWMTMNALVAVLQNLLALREASASTGCSRLECLRDQLPDNCFSILVLYRESETEEIFHQKDLKLQVLMSPISGWHFDVAIEFVGSVREGIPAGIQMKIEYDRHKLSYSGFLLLMDRFENIIFSEILGSWPARAKITPIQSDLLVSSSLSTTRAANSLMSYAYADNPTQDRVVATWESILKLRKIGILESFEQLGGNSTLYGRMLRAVEKEFGVRLDAKDLPSAKKATVRELARVLVKKSVKHQLQIISQKKEYESSPLFFFHGDVEGGGLYLLDLAKCLGAEQTIVAVHPHGLLEDVVPASIEEMADKYLKEIMRLKFSGPILIAGYCNAGLVAFEVARQFKSRGCEIGFLALVGSLYKTDVKSGSEKNRMRGGRVADVGSDSSLFARHMYAAQRYIPRYYNGTVTSLWPENDPSLEDPKVHWGRVAASVDSQIITGDHRTCISAHLGVLASKLAVGIRKAGLLTHTG